MIPNLLELGIDEAGRGPVLGPMVLAGVVVPEYRQELLKTWNVGDSKQYGSHARGKHKRFEIAGRIKHEFEHYIVIIPSTQIDHYVQTKSLNILEQETALQIIDTLRSDTVVLDGYNLFRPITKKNISAVNKADQSYLSVAAASIIAKHTRDVEFDQWCQKYRGDFGQIKGGGYANQATLKFVQWHLSQFGKLPDCYRKSYYWKALSN